jgi:c-di-GMP-binding flagellar brake protein YcgR
MAQNRRSSPRIHSLNFVAEEGLMFRTLDVSREGMLLEMGSPPPLGGRLDLQVAFGEDVVTIPAQVVRHELLEDRHVGVGVRFLRLEPEAKRALYEHVVQNA